MYNMVFIILEFDLKDMNSERPRTNLDVELFQKVLISGVLLAVSSEGICCATHSLIVRDAPGCLNIPVSFGKEDRILNGVEERHFTWYKAKQLLAP